MERNYLMVRAMTSQEIHFRTFFDNSIVAVGWSDVDFSACNGDDDLRQRVKNQYYLNQTGHYVSKKLNECLRFKHILSGDYIIIPSYSGIALAVANKNEIYSLDSQSIDLANQRSVTYKYKEGNILSVPRKDLSEGLQRRLRVPGMSVADLSEFAAEIDKLFDNPDSYSYPNEVKQREDETEKKFKQQLLENIQGGKTNLQTGGIGMENLVKELFECEGYSARVMAKTAFGDNSDADVEAWRDDAFMSVKIYAQVKHHAGLSGVEGIDQVIGAVSTNQKDHVGYFITSADVSDTDRECAENTSVTVIDGKRLVDIIYANLNLISMDTKKRLGIVMVPQIFD